MSTGAETIMNRARQPIVGPSVWLAPDMRQREREWTYRLSPAEIAEIEAALKSVHARALEIASIRREDFPLPTLGPVLERLCAEVLNGRGFALLRGLPVEGRPIAKCRSLLGHRHVFRQCPFTECPWSLARAHLRSWRQQRSRSKYPQLRHIGTAEFPY